MKMTKEELMEMLNKRFGKKNRLPAAKIKFQGEMGIVIRLAQNLSSTWQEGDFIVFWEDGEETILPDEFELAESDLWD